MELSAQKPTVCPKCEGWGTQKDGSTCNECNGKGFSIQTQQGPLVFNVPPYVDFRSRKMRSMVKGFVGLGCIVVLGIIVLIIVSKLL